MATSWSQWIWRRCERVGRIILVAVVALWSASPVWAVESPPVVQVSERKLSLTGLTNESLQRTFTLMVQGGTISGVQVIRNDLVDVETQRVLLSDQITVSALDGDDQVTNQERYAVTISGGERAGHYTGALQIRYENQPPTMPLTIDLDVTLTPVPAVDAEVTSKDLTLPIRSDVQSWPLGVPTSERAPILGELAISLIQSAEGPAQVTTAEVLTMRGTKGQTLPVDTLQVQTRLPLTIGDQGAAELRLVAQGRHLRADEYNGTLYVKVKDQSTPIQIPLKITVKDGVLLPLLALLLGPLIGMVVGWRNGGGLARNRLVSRIRNLERMIEEGHYLARDIQKELDALLDAIKLRLESVVVEELTQELDVVKNKLVAAQTEGNRFVEEECLPLQSEVEKLTPGRTVRDALGNDLKKVGNSVVYGRVATLPAAREELARLQKIAAEFQALVDSFQQLPVEKQKEITPTIDEAKTLAAIQEILQKATPPATHGGPQSTPQPHFGSYGTRATGARPALTLAERDWTRVQTRTRVLAWLSILLIYLFTIIVGFITLYVTSATFGAHAQDYITLVLWGAASGAIGNQAVDLRNIVQSGQGDNPGGN